MKFDKLINMILYIESWTVERPQVKELKRCMHKLSNLQKVDLRKSPLKLWTCKWLKFN